MTRPSPDSGRSRTRGGRWIGRTLPLHGLLALLAVARPRRWRWWLLAAAGLQAPLILGSLRPRSDLLGPNLRRLPPRARARRHVALTFDDGPDPEVTPRVLDLLDGAGAGATFFCIGERVRRHPALARDIVARGHRVENHTDRHRHDFAFLGPGGQHREVGRAQSTLARVCSTAPALFRPPAGFRNPFTESVLRHHGLGLVSWTRRGLDAVDRDPRRVYRRLATGLSAGDILLLHDGASRGWRGSPPVLDVLPRLLATLSRRALEPVTLAVALEAE